MSLTEKLLLHQVDRELINYPTLPPSPGLIGAVTLAANISDRNIDNIVAAARDNEKLAHLLATVPEFNLSGEFAYFLLVSISGSLAGYYIGKMLNEKFQTNGLERRGLVVGGAVGMVTATAITLYKGW